ncbi:hypothetical protein VTK73DRAFT_7603 [Phialemonium thermophilum]|uniref:Multicopper oxidase n=1 Tax=Phialemonium thermophilum TaxID=223376 RepID=A0ABR3WDG9_9PEZI
MERRLERGDGAGHERKSVSPRAWSDCEILAGSLVVAASVFFVLLLQWRLVLDSSSLATTWAGSGQAGSGAGTTGVSRHRDLKILLHPDDHVSRDPRVQNLSWTLSSGEQAPDGVTRRVLLVNGQFPGPTIEARPGDILNVDVFNALDTNVSLHWHGLHMRGANGMDGPVGITQCPIPPGGRFTYRVPTGAQTGTFWYHAHSEVLRGDGLYGAIVIHNPAVSEPLSYGYDEELLFMVGDWYHRPAQEVLADFMRTGGTGNEPNPSSLLVNGLGYFDCAMATPAAPVNCSEVSRPWLQLDKARRYRLRLINVGSMTGYSFGIADAQMQIVQVDGGYPVTGDVANSIGVLHPAERIDVVVQWNETVRDVDTEMVIDLDNEYFLQPNFALNPTQSFLLAVEPGARRRSRQDNTTMTRFDLREAQGAVLEPPLPEPDRAIMVYSSVQIWEHHDFRPMGFVNRTTWKAQESPLITVDRGSWDDQQLVPWTGPEPGWVDLVINNIDTTGHPFHLHGFDFYVVGYHEGLGGWDYYNPFDRSKPPRGGPFNVVDPVRRDTVFVPPYGYVVARFYADNEGIWALHCHVLWHQGSGMMMAVQVLGDERHGFSNSPSGLRAGRFSSYFTISATIAISSKPQK